MSKHSSDKKILEGAALIASMSLSQLQEFQTMLSAEITKRQIETKREALTQIRNIAAANGLDLAELLKSTSPKLPKPPRTSGPVQIQYRHPDDSNLTWTGRGRRPQWVLDWNDTHGNTDGIKVA
jgi:DNA-binding protein H-NS